MKKNVFWLLAAMFIPASAVVAQDDYDEPQQIALSLQERQMVDNNNDFAFGSSARCAAR